jgi:hypothetical protein
VINPDLKEILTIVLGTKVVADVKILVGHIRRGEGVVFLYFLL